MEIPSSNAELIKKLEINGYELVILLSKRTRELMYGAKQLVEDKSNNFIKIAIKEVIDGKIKLQR